MGQQQLLLVILVTIIVGIATVVAINVFGQSAENANLDATRQDVLTIGAMAQGWILKPEALGGGGGDWQNGSTDVTMDDLGFGYASMVADGTVTTGTAGTEYTNANATYSLSINGDELTVTAVPIRASDKVVTGKITKENISVSVAAASGT